MVVLTLRAACARGGPAAGQCSTGPASCRRHAGRTYAYWLLHSCFLSVLSMSGCLRSCSNHCKTIAPCLQLCSRCCRVMQQYTVAARPPLGRHKRTLAHQQVQLLQHHEGVRPQAECRSQLKRSRPPTRRRSKSIAPNGKQKRLTCMCVHVTLQPNAHTDTEQIPSHLFLSVRFTTAVDRALGAPRQQL